MAQGRHRQYFDVLYLETPPFGEKGTFTLGSFDIYHKQRNLLGPLE